MASNLNSLINLSIRQGITKSAALHTKILRKHAESYGWPQALSSSLSVSDNPEDQKIMHPGKFADEINMLEYGTTDVPISPAVRTFRKTYMEEA